MSAPAREQLAARLESGLGPLMPAFLAGRRWYGAKARAIARVGLEDLAWLGEEPLAPALALIQVRFVDGGAERYALLLAFDGRDEGPALIGSLPPPGAPLRMREAGAEPPALLALLGVSGHPAGIPTRRGGRLVHGDAYGSAGRRFDPRAVHPGSIQAVRSEQSNTSARLGVGHVFKLFRRLEPGENPEVEIGRFLTARTAFEAMAALRGSWTHESPEGTRTTLAVVQDWVENQGDGWTHVVAELGAVLGGSADPGLLARDALALGRVTADFHIALASGADDPDFAPRPIGEEDRARWRASLRDQEERALSLVERRMETLDEPSRALARRVLAGRARLVGAADRIATSGAAGLAIRVHGDYHLGQTLKIPRGFTIIDFEGEPARPLAERRAKQCALKDVAGMLRSFDYAIETARAERAGAPSAAAAPPLRETFLEAYLERVRASGAAFLPEDRDLASWIDFFELDKALYEAEYELNHRPAWVGIPLRGIARILEGGA